MKNGKAPFISEDELSLVLSYQNGANALRNRVVLLFSHYLGLRAKELASLRLDDVFDVTRNQIKQTIRLLGAYTKGNKYREVFLMDQETINQLLAYIEKAHQHKQPKFFLFESQKGGGFSANTMQRMIAGIYKKAGIKASSHSGRRSFATRLIRKNVDIYSIKQLMGHTSINTTQEYFVSDPNRLKDEVLKLSQ
ncbi:hypothetical protein P255_02999 [Acinetobacter brisouii CIP 110357]|uniref:Tyr recombinase domain-containing protein n=1 Tax=Acinetobacter brisouii CIP 110357 TaxID=1341683 RepID=V2UAL8_9GAMM|nr:site-specific integrase [Acinetobacter brisouii]ENV46220.1 hypothetical protein F954_02855 [Acinetobacter brisouii ANC 4119]ESK47517.1 hypothetical protein P255_02999 [Acinetobacter brisouii CIP 110357]